MGNGEPRFRNFLAELLFWGSLLSLGGWLYFKVFHGAVERQRETRDWVRELRLQNRRLEDERDRLVLENRALEDGERTIYERELREYGYVPADRVRVVPAGADGSLPPGTAPKGK